MEPSQSHQGGNGALCLDPEAGETLARPNGLPGQSLDHREAWTCPLPECFFIGNGGVHDHMFGHPKVAFLQEGRCSQPPPPISCSFYSPQTSQDLYSGGILFAFLSNKCLLSSLVAGPGLEGHKWVISYGTEGRGWGRGGREPPPRNYCQE